MVDGWTKKISSQHVFLIPTYRSILLCFLTGWLSFRLDPQLNKELVIEWDHSNLRQMNQANICEQWKPAQVENFMDLPEISTEIVVGAIMNASVILPPSGVEKISSEGCKLSVAVDVEDAIWNSMLAGISFPLWFKPENCFLMAGHADERLSTKEIKQLTSIPQQRLYVITDRTH